MLCPCEIQRESLQNSKRVRLHRRRTQEVLQGCSAGARKQMNPEPSLRPYGDAPPERGGPSPHLSDYWQVVLRRLWLVLLVFGVTTASAIFAVSRHRVYFQSSLSLQVNDPAQPARGLVQPGRISGLDIFVDPIESEIQVLRSTQIATAVITTRISPRRKRTRNGPSCGKASREHASGPIADHIGPRIEGPPRPHVRGTFNLQRDVT